MDWRVHAALVFVQVSFGGFHVAGKSVLEHLSPLSLGCLRVLVATPILLLLARIFEGPQPIRAHWRMLALLGFLGVFVNQVLFITGLKLTSATNAGILMPSIPVFAAAAAVALRVEKLEMRTVSGIALAVGGALVMLDPSRFGALDSGALGNLCLLANALAFGVFLVLQRPLLKVLPPLTLVAWSFLFGGIGVLLVGARDLAQLPSAPLTGADWAKIAYIVLIPTALNYALNTWAVRRSSPSLVATYTTLQPVTAATLAAFFLGEQLEWRQLWGFLLIVAGLVVVTARRGRGADHAIKS